MNRRDAARIAQAALEETDKAASKLPRPDPTTKAAIDEANQRGTTNRKRYGLS